MARKFFQFNIFAQCKKYNIPLWQCPQFLFVVMGFVIMVASLAFYAIGERYVADPRAVAFVVLMVSMTLLVIAFVITRSFEDLAETNRMKSEFVNIVSHQLRAPLTNLRWATQFLTSAEFVNSVREEHAEYFDIIKENSARMENLIDDLLTITRLRGGRMDTRRMKFSLAHLTKEVVSEYGSLALASNIEIELIAPDNLPQVFASYPLTKIVIENLIGNAISYSPGSQKVVIKLAETAGKVELQIKDQGMGIPAEDRKYIFQKFFRAKNAIQAEVYGTGLGLFIVKLILDGMGGRVWFISKKGKGTTFYFTLPTG